MEHLIDKNALVAEIERLKKTEGWCQVGKDTADVYYARGFRFACERIISFIDTLEVKEVDLEKLGEIARHLIAVKEHIEDMRLDKEEWFMIEKIGYPEKFKVQKGK